METLNRLKVGTFDIKNAITLEELQENKEHLEYIQTKLIKLEDIFKEKETIKLKGKDLDKFLNGVKLNIQAKDGIYKIQNEKEKFIGTGEIKENRLKRDVII